MRHHPAWTCARTLLILLPVLGGLGSPPARAGETYDFQEATHKSGSLQIINGLPVMVVEGTPEQIGEQIGTLAGAPARELVHFPRNLLEQFGQGKQWARLVQFAQVFVGRFPLDHRREMTATAKTAGVEFNELVAANVMPDAYRAFGCSSILIDAENSATGGPLFGRNLDFYTLGKLYRYTLVVVYRPEGKHAFVSVGFPGLTGCLSGMNDAGLTLAVHEVYRSKDESPMLNPLGTPYGLCFRRLLEECETVDEAVTLLRSMKRTTLLNLAISDPKSNAVLEITPKSVVVRRGEQGVCPCTNHFRTEKLSETKQCWRYDRLSAAAGKKNVTVDDVAAKLKEVTQKKFTFQTMIFEPATLKLHLAVGTLPSTDAPWRTLELAELLTGAREKKSISRTSTRKSGQPTPAGTTSKSKTAQPVSAPRTIAP